MERYFERVPKVAAPAAVRTSSTESTASTASTASSTAGDALDAIETSSATSKSSRLSSPMARLPRPADSPKRPAEPEAAAESAKRPRSAAASDASDAGGAPRTVSSSSATPLRAPMKIVTWNCNGLSSRLSNADNLKAFVAFVEKEAPDIIFLQEVRMSAAGPPGAKPGDGQARNRAKVHVGAGKKGREDNDLVTKTFVR
jgi:hypothetical protein